MQIDRTVSRPCDKRLFLLLCEVGPGKEKAGALDQELRNMAAANLIARFESKLDSRLDTIRSGLTVQRWLVGFGFAALIAPGIA